MRQRIRIAAVTAGLVVAGGVFGTIAGTLVLLVWLVVLDPSNLSLAGLGTMLFAGTVIGGGLGAVLGPLAAWTVMRDVPLWLAVGGTTLATFTIGGLGLWITGSPIVAIVMGVVGLFVSGAALQKRFRPREQRRIDGG